MYIIVDKVPSLAVHTDLTTLMFLTNITFKDCRHVPVMISRPYLLAFVCDFVKKTSTKQVQVHFSEGSPTTPRETCPVKWSTIDVFRNTDVHSESQTKFLLSMSVQTASIYRSNWFAIVLLLILFIHRWYRYCNCLRNYVNHQVASTCTYFHLDKSDDNY